MLTVRRANERGHFQNDWLDSRHTFSFGEYHDPEHMGVSVLRVLNDDKVTPGAGFPTHPHKDMEIVSYVLQGELAHKDSMGNGSTIRPGDVQRMSAGSGVRHSEFNPSDQNGANFLQIWLLPSRIGIEPGYEQKYFAPEERQNQLKLLLSPNGQDGSIQATTDALLYGSLLDESQTLEYAIQPQRTVYLHVAKGELKINSEWLQAGDGVAIKGENKVTLKAEKDSEILLFDLPE